MNNNKMPFNHLLNPGHSACAGCGQLIAARHVLDAAGKNTIVVGATGCLEVTTSQYPFSSYKVPWIHSLFENSSAVASGIRAALDFKLKNLRTEEQKNVNIISQGGDGATFDIGLGLISGMWERGEDILYVCYDNEAYMNTGYQASGSTPLDSYTTTSPAGKESTGSQLKKKDMLSIALAHKCTYVATASVGDVLDLAAKVRRALKIKGPKYLQIFVPCVPGWGIESNMTIKVAKLAQQTGLYPIVEFENGKLTLNKKVPKQKVKVEEYLKLQKRFKHLFKTPEGKNEIKKIQEIADGNIEKYRLKS